MPLNRAATRRPRYGAGRRRYSGIHLFQVAAAACLALAACGGNRDTGGVGSFPAVPRNRTLITDCASAESGSGQILDYNAFNPFLLTGTTRTGKNYLFEPLYFYNAFAEADNLIPWIATAHEYNADYTELTIHIRPGVTWSDGQPWTAQDLVYTIDMLRANAPELTFSTDLKTWVQQAVALDDRTARITLTAPNPRFLFTYFTNNFDNGIPIVPRHIWENEDPRAFRNLDPARGWPVVSGPYRLALSVPQQRVWDRRPDWWAAQTGFRQLPQVERIIHLPYMGEGKRVQKLIADQMDICLDLRPPNIRSIVEANPRVTTWTGRQPPFGYLDWWPICLGFNNLEEPFSDPRIRHAIDHAIDREQLVEVGWQGAGTSTLLPFPDFPPMRRYTRGVQDLLAQHEIGRFDPQRTAAIMRQQGWRRDEDEFWSRDGRVLKIVIDVFEIFQDLAPVLVAQLEQAGFDADFRMTRDAYSRMAQGTARAFLMGNGGSVRDPYFTLSFYHSRFVRPTGTHSERFWRWRHAGFDALVDEMGRTAPGDPHLERLFRRAMAIWLAELPAIPLVQWYHRIPQNETYWTGWPSAGDPRINSAYWHKTWLLVLLGLRPTQP